MPLRGASRPLLLAGLWALGACSGGAHEPRQDETAFGTPQQTASGRLSIARPLLDLPAALHLRPAGFSARFGPPTPLPPGFADPGKFSVQSTISTDSLALFRVKNLAMVVAFSSTTGAV